ncbi:M20 family metallopeptidase [Aliihoeflea sp. PC F10.4]
MSFSEQAQAISATYFDNGSFLAELARLVAAPTESQDKRGASHLRPYLTDLLQPEFEKLGFACALHENPDPAGAPILLATRVEDAALPTVLIYGHGDVVRAMEGQWRDGIEPFALTEKNDRVYGRGIADNKSQHLINIRALEALIAAQGKLGFNAKVLIEMGEEVGSPGLKAFCERNADALAADVLIASDGPRLDPAVPTVFTGARGGMMFDLKVDLRDGAHHSGNFGGLLADPAIVLSHAIASITDARGQIKIAEWRPTSLTERVREIIAALPPVEAGIALDPNWGEESLTMNERVFGWNSFAVLAMTSGRPEAPVGAISGCARASCQLRFVVGTDRDDILPALRRHLDREGFGDVTITAAGSGGFAATRTDADNDWVRFTLASLERSTGRKPHLLPNLGGSLPNDCFAETLGLPTIWIPHSYAGCSQHAPNEHILKPLARQALLAMTALFADLSNAGSLRRS